MIDQAKEESKKDEEKQLEKVMQDSLVEVTDRFLQSIKTHE